MRPRQRCFLRLLPIAVVAIALLFFGTGRYFGIPLPTLGAVLLVAVAAAGWSLARAGTRQEGAQAEIEPAEWQAWIGVAFSALAFTYFLVKLPLLQGEVWPQVPMARAVAGNLVLLLIGWAVLSRFLAGRWRDRIQEDERDRAIGHRAAHVGSTGTTMAIIVMAVLLAFSPPDRLYWASHFMIANLLVLALMAGVLIEHLAQVVLYWRDRH